MIWLKTYQELGSVAKAARRCGISRSTLYRWINRYESDGINGLSDKSCRPKKLANQKISKTIEEKILNCRKKYNWGPQRIANYLSRRKIIELSSMSVWCVLSKHNVKPVLRKQKKSDFKRYNKEVPGERGQMDVTKIGHKQYQFTAIDDCTRFKVIRIFPNKKAESAISFLWEVLDTFYFLFKGYIQTGEQSFLTLISYNIRYLMELQNEGTVQWDGFLDLNCI